MRPWMLLRRSRRRGSLLMCCAAKARRRCCILRIVQSKIEELDVITGAQRTTWSDFETQSDLEPDDGF